MNGHVNMEHRLVKTELLIVGAGPAGASLACFLASYGYTGILISAAAGTAETPRAHITNMAALECLRDIGLERDCMAVASNGENMQHSRWCYSMAGEEFARAYSWGHDPNRKGDYETASPCNHVDLPQTELEPILIKRAIHSGWTVRFNTTFLKISRSSQGEVVSEVRDDMTKQTYQIQSRFLFGCDGARSQVVRELSIPLVKKPVQGLAINVLVKADLSHLIKTRNGNLHWAFRPDEEYPPWAWFTIVRMVKPWTEWMFIFLPHPSVDITKDPVEGTDKEYLARVKADIGDDSIPVEIINSSKWWINETVAEYYSDGNVFCLGDAVHRHPPFGGLGSNTCIQDAFNLAWKVSHYLSGRAGFGLLDTFNSERQPVGHVLVTRANSARREHIGWLTAVGMTEPDIMRRREIFAELEEGSPKGRQRRQEFQRGIEDTAAEFHGLGMEMNQCYSSDGIYQADESSPLPAAAESIKEHFITTYPGCRLPHAWLNSRLPGKQLSTIDLAGHGQFCLLTGPGGEAWKVAADKVSQDTGVPIKSYSIGWKQDYEDVYLDWARRREVEEDGCVLVRPDRFVAWRSRSMLADSGTKLAFIMNSVLRVSPGL